MPEGVRILAPADGRHADVLSEEALDFVAGLQRQFGRRRGELLARRVERRARIEAGEMPGFLPETAEVRAGDWQVAPPPAALLDRRCEITGPVERKMMINALNSGARVFMADFEDANSPTWANCLDGQVNCIDAVRGTISHEAGGKRYELATEIAQLVVRPRGWHLVEKHLHVDGEPVSASLFDFGLYVFHNAAELVRRDLGPYLYLPKLESHLEARLWNDVFCAAQDALGIPRGTIRATVLIETILAAFEMDEILYELRDHSAGLNAGRWDYIFSVVKTFRRRPDFLLPDRAQVTMTVPFMRAYSELLVETCHRRGAHAIGGMAAFIPSRRDPEANEIALTRVRDDKVREATGGFDGTWVAHPDLVAVASAVFDEVLADQPNQITRRRPDVDITPADLLAVAETPGEITEEGLRTNVNVGILYIESWLRGVGAAAIYNLMEDAATAEISRSQVWQWVENGRFTADEVRRVVDEELEAIRRTVGDESYDAGRFAEARAVFERVALAPDFEEFLTTVAYELID